MAPLEARRPAFPLLLMELCLGTTRGGFNFPGEGLLSAEGNFLGKGFAVRCWWLAPMG